MKFKIGIVSGSGMAYYVDGKDYHIRVSTNRQGGFQFDTFEHAQDAAASYKRLLGWDVVIVAEVQ